MGEASAELGHAGYYIGIHNYQQTGVELIAAEDEFYSMRSQLYSLGVNLQAALYWIENNWPTPTEITWESICLAWAKDDFKGRAMTIGFIDRMRQLLWDEPYYIKFAARPEQEGF